MADAGPPDAPTEDARASTLTLRSDRNVFDLDTVKKAAYRLGDRCTVDIVLADDQLVCTLHPLPKIPAAVVATLADDLRNEVLDQDLRRTISAETAPVRNAVLAYAFSRTGLQDVE